MKALLPLIFCCISSHLFSQTEKSTTVQVNLFLPVHVKNSLTPNDKLTIYLQTFPDDTTKIKKKITAKKIRDNIYAFQLPKTKYWFVGFNIGKFSYMMLCVNNSKDDETAWDVMLENKATDFAKIEFLPPCIKGEDDE